VSCIVQRVLMVQLTGALHAQACPKGGEAHTQDLSLGAVTRQGPRRDASGATHLNRRQGAALPKIARLTAAEATASGRAAMYTCMVSHLTSVGAVTAG
jgi:hypothetical protein